MPLILFLCISALWTSPTTARVTWSQPPQVQLTCVYRVPVSQPPILIRCWQWLPPGGYAMTIGDVAPVDGNMRPAGGDSYIVTQDETVIHAPLRSVTRLPVLSR